MKKALLLCSCLLFCIAAIARENNTPIPQQFTNKKAPLSFMENKGQITDQNYQPRPDIQFQLKAANGLTIFVGDGALHYQFSKADKMREPRKPEDKFDPKKMMEHDSTTYTIYRMDVELLGANKHAKVITEHKQDYYENYYTTGTSENGATVYAYSKITYKDIYPNIDWVLYTKNNELKHEFIVKQGGNPADIKLKYGGATNLQLHNDGSLEATTPQGTITEKSPVSYTQEGQQVKSSFSLKENVLSYEVGNYEGTLVIDPGIAWGTYFGGTDTEMCYRVETDKNNNAFISGVSVSVANIATAGAYQQIINTVGGYDAFLAKFDNNGNRIWGTYFGGSSTEFCYGLATDRYNNIYIAGGTASTLNIATSGVYQTTLSGVNDAFLAKFNNNGSLIWSTYFGGNLEDYSRGVSVDSNCSVFLTGQTLSTSNIATMSAFQVGLAGYYDAFLAKFDSTGNIVWSTYYGGNGGDFGFEVANDNVGNVFLYGNTWSTSGIATVNAFQTMPGGVNDAFLVKFDSYGNQIWGTYFGGSGWEYPWINDIEIDSLNNVYITGSTSSNGLATVGTYQTSNFFNGDAYLVKFDNVGNRLWCTYFGGYGIEFGTGIALNKNGKIFMSGYTTSPSNISTIGASQPGIYNNVQDAYLAEFDNTGNIIWATYFGGNQLDMSYDVAIDGNNSIFLTGYTNSPNNIATQGAYQTVLGATGVGGNDAFLVKFDTICYGLPPTVSLIMGPDSVCTGNIYNYTDSVTNGYWICADTTIAIIDANGHLKAKNAGNTILYYILSNNCGYASSNKFITVLPSPTAIISPNGNLSICPNNSLLLQANAGIGLTYQWKFNNNLISGATNNNYSASLAGKYRVIVTNPANGCATASDSVVLGIYNVPTAFINVNGQLINCVGNSVTLVANAGSGLSYQWYVGNSIIPNAISQTYSPTQTGNYWVIISASGNCPDTAKAVTIIFEPHPLAAITALGDTTICSGFSSVLNANQSVWFTYQWLQNGATISGATTSSYTAVASGIYKVTITDTVCSSTSNAITIIVNTPSNINITQSGNMLSSGTAFSNYQWYLNGVAIVGATDSSYLPSQNGNYYVVANDSNNCSGQSNTISFTVGIDEVNGSHLFSVNPNPVNDVLILIIKGTGQHTESRVEVIDVLGQLVLIKDLSSDNRQLSTENWAPGVYFVRYKDNEGRVGTVKVVKE